MLNIAALEYSSEIKIQSLTELMLLAVNDLRTNRPKALEYCDFKSLQAHKSLMSMPNIAVRTYFAAEAPKNRVSIHIVQFNLTIAFNDLRTNNRLEPLERRDFKGLQAICIYA